MNRIFNLLSNIIGISIKFQTYNILELITKFLYQRYLTIELIRSNTFKPYILNKLINILLNTFHYYLINFDKIKMNDLTNLSQIAEKPQVTERNE